MSNILDKNLEDFIKLAEQSFPQNDLFEGSFLDQEKYPNRRTLYEMQLKGFFENAQLIQQIFDGYFLLNDLLLDYWLVELGLPDIIFTDLDTNDKKRAAIIAKRNLKNVYGKKDIVDIMNVIGVSIDIVSRSTLIGFPKKFPYMFLGAGQYSRFAVYVKILDNPKNYSQDFILSILSALTTAIEAVVIIR